MTKRVSRLECRMNVGGPIRRYGTGWEGEECQLLVDKRRATETTERRRRTALTKSRSKSKEAECMGEEVRVKRGRRGSLGLRLLVLPLSSL